MRRMILAALVFGLGLVTANSVAEGQESSTLGFGGGIFDTSAFADEGDFDAFEAGLVWRGPTRLAWGVGLMAGVSANDDSAWWTYVGLRRPFPLADRWELGPTFGAAYYEEGDSKNLGHEVEFRSGLEVNRKFAGGSSIGFEFYHLSNAGLSDTNPGINSLWVVFSVPLGR